MNDTLERMISLMNSLVLLTGGIMIQHNTMLMHISTATELGKIQVKVIEQQKEFYKLLSQIYPELYDKLAPANYRVIHTVEDKGPEISV